ncbi:MAG TPA: hypothetical protein VGK73_23380 [Polyangiaceae bacterium]
MSPARSSVACGLLSLALAGCFGRGSVTRAVDGQVREGRAIDEAAYASYLRAAFLESTGQRELALEELERALDWDPVSPEILTRIGELRCGTNLAANAAGPAPDAAHAGLVAFSRALGLDDTYGPAWLGRARCLERSGRRDEALVAAERAVYYDPLRIETTTTTARLLFALDRPNEAWTWLDARVLLEPGSVDAERARLAAARAHNDAPRVARSERALGALGRLATPGSRTRLEQAIAAGDLSAARARAMELRISSTELALFAVKRAPALAFEQALSVLRADPSDTSAWVAAIAAADLLGDDQRFADALDELAADPLPPSPEALELLARLISRRAGKDAEAAFARALSPH